MSTHCGCGSAAGCACGCGSPGVQEPANRPGLPALAYRVGTYASFLAAMRDRLATIALVLPEHGIDADGRQKMAVFHPLRDLLTRAPDDPASAWLDAWASVADVLTFYQERIANEGYLATATERRSVLELARLIGYTLRPGVAATVYLAFDIEEDRMTQPARPRATVLSRGLKAQSVPAGKPGELPQMFETAEDLDARSGWNNLQVRLTRPTTLISLRNFGETDSTKAGPRLYLRGVATGLKPNDPLLVTWGDTRRLLRVREVTPDPAAGRTRVRLASYDFDAEPDSLLDASDVVIKRQIKVAESLFPSPTPSNVRSLAAKLAGLPATLSGRTQNEQVRVVGSLIGSFRQEAAGAPQNPPGLAGWLMSVCDDLQSTLDWFGDPTPAVVPVVPVLGERNPNLLNQLKAGLLKSAAPPPPNSAALSRHVASGLGPQADSTLGLLRGFEPRLSDALEGAFANARVTATPDLQAFAFRVKAAPFGATAPLRRSFPRDGGEPTVIGEWPVVEWKISDVAHGGQLNRHEGEAVLYLDSNHEGILPSTITAPSWVAFDGLGWSFNGDARLGTQLVPFAALRAAVATVRSVTHGLSRADYGIQGQATLLRLNSPWLVTNAPALPASGTLQSIYDSDFQALRGTSILAQSENLDLAEEPIDAPVEDGKTIPIELDGVYSDLKSGRWLIVSGERILPGTTGVTGSELVMLAGVEHRFSSQLPGDRLHTFLTLAQPLAFRYVRRTVVIHGNVAKATHGETRAEILGGGDASKALQQFALRQSPLTFVPAPNPSGVDSTLEIRVNDVQWHEANGLAALGPDDRGFVARTSDAAVTTAIFGNGVHGCRVPTGQENVKATYRVGLGDAGNVNPRQISVPLMRPLGLRGVINPLAATGGANADDRDQARENAPLAVAALDRLVSVQDYADFSRTFAGIAKAGAVRLTDGQRELVHLTLAGIDDVPIDEHSDLLASLRQALNDYGAPFLPVQIARRELLTVVLGADVSIDPDYLWVDVEARLRAMLLAQFGFRRRALGQSLFLSEILRAMQAVAGVTYVDVNAFGFIAEADLLVDKKLDAKIAAMTAAPRPDPVVRAYGAQTLSQAAGRRSDSVATDNIYPAQLAIFSPANPATLILNHLTP